MIDHLIDLRVTVGLTAQVFQQSIDCLETTPSELPKTVRVQQVAHAQAATPDLVFIGWTDATSGGSDLPCPSYRLTSPVQAREIR
jgi:hypothetical protein